MTTEFEGENPFIKGESKNLKVSRRFSLMKMPSDSTSALIRASSTKDYRKESKQFSLDAPIRSKRGTLENIQTPKSDLFYMIPAHKGPVMCFLIDKERLYTGGWDMLIRSWNTELERCTHTYAGHDGWISCLALYDDCLYSGSSDSTIRGWDVRTGKCDFVFEGHSGHIQHIEFHQLDKTDNTKYLFSTSIDGTLRIWDVEKLECLRVLKAGDSLKNLAFYQDKVITCSQLSIQIWDPQKESKEACVSTLKGHEDTIWNMLVHNSVLYSCSWDHTIKSWDLETMKLQSTFRGHTEQVFIIIIDDNTLFSGGADCTARSWSLDGQLGVTFKGHEGSVEHLAHRNGKLFTASSDTTIRIWHAKTGEMCSIYRGHMNYILEIRMSSGILYSRGFDGIVAAWASVPLEKPISPNDQSQKRLHKRVNSAGKISLDSASMKSSMSPMSSPASLAGSPEGSPGRSRSASQTVPPVLLVSKNSSGPPENPPPTENPSENQDGLGYRRIQMTNSSPAVVITTLEDPHPVYRSKSKPFEHTKESPAVNRILQVRNHQASSDSLESNIKNLTPETLDVKPSKFRSKFAKFNPKSRRDESLAKAREQGMIPTRKIRSDMDLSKLQLGICRNCGRELKEDAVGSMCPLCEKS